MGVFDWFKRRRSRAAHAPGAAVIGDLPSFDRSGPSVDEMTAIVAGAARVRCRRPTQAEVLYETSEPEALTALAAALRARPPTGEYCMCFGTLVFELEGERAAAVTLHHGVSLRWEGSGGNVELIDPGAAMDWLSARGIGFVREEYEESRRRAAENEEKAKRWIEAMPAAWVPFFDDMRASGDLERPAWTAALEAALPDPVERARALLDLLGSGEGPWSGVPSWEVVPEVMLATTMPLDTLLAALGDAPDARRSEGAARLFCGFWYQRKHGAKRARIPEALRGHLLAHVRATGDADKQERARAVLGGR